jgi:hypothetical protein
MSELFDETPAEGMTASLELDFPTKVGLPAADRGYMLAVRVVDWDRIRARVDAVGSTTARDVFLGLAFGFAAVAATAGVAVLPLIGVKNLNPAVIPALLVVLIGGLIAAAVSAAAFRVVGERQTAMASDIVLEMDEIKDSFPAFRSSVLPAVAAVAEREAVAAAGGHDERGSPDDSIT